MKYLIALLCLLLPAMALAQQGPGELGLPGVTIYGTPPGPGWTPVSTGNDRGQWYQFGAGFSLIGNQITVAGGGGGGTPGGVNGDLQTNVSGFFGGVHGLLGDVTWTGPSTFTVNTYRGGTPFGTLAALNIGTGLLTSAGNLNVNLPGGTLAAHNFATALSAGGTLTGAQPACSDLTNSGFFCNGTAASGLTGLLQAAQFPALTGDTTTTGSSLATTTSALHFGPGNPVALPGTAPPSGGLVYAPNTSSLAVSSAFTLNLPLLGGGPGAAPIAGTRSGNTTEFGTVSGSTTPNDCAKFDLNGNLVDNGGTCGGSAVPAGSPPQLVGYSAANTPESETVSGDGTFARTGTNAYKLVVLDTNGVAFTGAATMALPVISTNGGSGINSPTAHDLMVAEGGSPFNLVGLGSGQLLIGQTSGSDPAAESISGDNSLSASGLMQTLGLHFGSSNPVSLPSVAPSTGGLAYFSSATNLASSPTLGANLPLFGGGSGASPFTGTRSGNTTEVATVNGSTVTNDCAKWDSNGNIIDNGSTCGAGGSSGIPSSTFASLPASPTTGQVYNISDANICVSKIQITAGSGSPLNGTCNARYNGTGWYPITDAQLNELSVQAVSASLGGTTTVTIGNQYEYDPTLSANSIINLALATGIATNAIVPINLRVCQNSTGGYTLTINGPAGTTLTWNADGGTQPQPSTGVNQCSLYQLTYRQAINTITEDSPMLVASPPAIAAVEACAANNWLHATSTTGGGSADCSQPAFSNISGTLSNSQLPTSGVTAGSYTNTNLTVNAQGIVTAAANGSGGGGGSGLCTDSLTPGTFAPACTAGHTYCLAPGLYTSSTATSCAGANVTILCQNGSTEIEYTGATDGIDVTGSSFSISGCDLDHNNNTGSGTGPLLKLSGEYAQVNNLFLTDIGTTNSQTGAIEVTSTGFGNSINNVMEVGAVQTDNLYYIASSATQTIATNDSWEGLPATVVDDGTQTYALIGESAYTSPIGNPPGCPGPPYGGFLCQASPAAANPPATAGMSILYPNATNTGYVVDEGTTSYKMVANSGGVVEYGIDFSGALGALASTAGATLLQECSKAVSAGHFTGIICVTDLNGGSCATAPTFNIRDNTATTNGTALTCSTSAGTATQGESLTFSAGDLICITRTVNGATCTTPYFGLTAHVSLP